MKPCRQRGDPLAQGVCWRLATGRSEGGGASEVEVEREQRWPCRILASQFLPRQIGRRATNSARATFAYGTPPDRPRQGHHNARRCQPDGGANFSRVTPENLSSPIVGPDLEHR